MSLFKSHLRKKKFELNTAALPDLIFTVLFFFMLVTNMKKDQVKVEFRVPQATELERLTNKSTTSYIYIGHAIDHDGDANAMRIQLNDRYVNVDEIQKALGSERSGMSAEDAKEMKVDIKADRDTPMGMINDVKQALRKANVLNVIYSAEQELNR